MIDASHTLITAAYYEFIEWPTLAVGTRVAELAGRHVAVEGVGPDGRNTVVLLTFERLRGKDIAARVGDTATRDPMPIAQRITCPGSVTLRDVILAHTAVRASGAAEPARIRWPISGSPMTRAVMFALVIVVAIAAVLLQQPGLLFFAVPLAAGAWWSRDTRHLLIPPTVIGKRGQLMPSEVMARLPLDSAPAGPTPFDRVTLIRSVYGELLSDIIYRIENSALFDAAQPSTNRFQVALALWDAQSPNAPEMADEIETSFAAARREAEELGFSHLPSTAQDSARRAAKAVTTALGDGSEAERASALSRAEEILTSLALYYLPSIDRSSPSLIGTRRAIEPFP